MTIERKREVLRDRTAIWEPRWEDHEPAARNIARKSVWRVAPLYDYDDLLGEAGLVFARCVRKYPRVVDPPHFMRLFRVALQNKIHNLATRRTRSIYQSPVVSINYERTADDEPLTNRLEAAHDNRADERFRATVRDLEPSLIPLLDAADDLRPDPKGFRARNPNRRRPDGSRMTTNEFLCRLAGYEPAGVDLRGRLNRIFVLGGSEDTV